MKEELQYPHIGQFHWKYFQLENGKRNVAVSSTVPRVEMMLDNGCIREFVDKKKEVTYAVLFDSEYVFDYLCQKVVVNMNWVDNGKLDSEVLKAFLGEFYEYCDKRYSNASKTSIEAQAKYLSEQFPHKTAQQWEKELIGNETNIETQLESTSRDEKIHSTDDATRTEEEEIMDVVNLINEAKHLEIPIVAVHGKWIELQDNYPDTEEEVIGVTNWGSKAEWLGEGIGTTDDDDEKMISMNDCDADIEEDCGDWKPASLTEDDTDDGSDVCAKHSILDLSIRELKKIATDLKIKGYGNMSKSQLINAITAVKTS
ncbi:Rho termination factor N-terminal domain-containing protein [Nostoc sp.]|uniref:Rho termination factor N-terminal domain-containing protein n=1 Tax=Nostoc sp. TaxID=1180 RepID=UPI002FFD0C52